MYKKYLIKSLIWTLILLFPIGLSAIFLYNTGELSSFNTLIQKQDKISSPSITGLTLRNLGYHYKKNLVQKKIPKILILGSSRVMQLRQSFFDEPSFVNAGGAMSTLEEGLQFAQELFTSEAPQIVILGIDFWWFNENFIKPFDKPVNNLFNPVKIGSSYLKPYWWLVSKKLKLKDFLTLILNDTKGHIGVDGVLNQTGFGEDGSYYYTKIITGKEKSFDERFQFYLKKVQDKGPRFESAEFAHQQHIANLLKLLDFFKNKNTKVILFFTPVAPSIYKAMLKYPHQYQYINDIKLKLHEKNIVYLDYLDSSSIESSDCEFVDGIHGGDITYARILQDLTRQHPDLKKWVNRAYLDQVMEQYSGLAMIPNNKITSKSEIDFLKIDCQKIIKTS